MKVEIGLWLIVILCYVNVFLLMPLGLDHYGAKPINFIQISFYLQVLWLNVLVSFRSLRLIQGGNND